VQQSSGHSGAPGELKLNAELFFIRYLLRRFSVRGRTPLITGGSVSPLAPLGQLVTGDRSKDQSFPPSGHCGPDQKSQPNSTG
jgi:hypothetical protein